MTQPVIDCGPFRLVWIPSLVAPSSNQIKTGVFEIRCGLERAGMVSLVGTMAPHAVIGYEVLPEFRSRGFASAAVAAVLSVAPDFGVSVVTAQCRSNNAHSRGVLEKNGFTLSSSAPFWTNAPGSAKKRDNSLLFMVYQWIATSTVITTAASTGRIAFPERQMK